MSLFRFNFEIASISLSSVHFFVIMANSEDKYERTIRFTAPGLKEIITERTVDRSIDSEIRSGIRQQSTKEGITYQVDIKDYDAADITCKVDEFRNLVVHARKVKCSYAVANVSEENISQFRREIQLPTNVDENSLTTKIYNGMVTMSLIFKSAFSDREWRERSRELVRERERERDKQEELSRSRSREREEEKRREKEAERREGERQRERQREEERQTQRERYWETQSTSGSTTERERGHEQEKEWTYNWKNWHGD